MKEPDKRGEARVLHRQEKQKECRDQITDIEARNCKEQEVWNAQAGRGRQAGRQAETGRPQRGDGVAAPQLVERRTRDL